MTYERNKLNKPYKMHLLRTFRKIDFTVLSLAALEHYLRTDNNSLTLASFTLTWPTRRDNIRHAVVILSQAKLVLVLPTVTSLGTFRSWTSTPSPSN